MLRSEQLVHSTTGNMDEKFAVIRTCLGSVETLTRQLQTSNDTHALGRTFVSVDVGRFGSGSWHTTLQDAADAVEKFSLTVQDAVIAMVNTTMTFLEWESGFVKSSGGIEDRGYIAALQRTIASRADCLVLVGGGNFIKLALHEYLLNHPDPQTWCIHYVCVNEFAHQYDRIIHDQKAQFLQNHLKALSENV